MRLSHGIYITRNITFPRSGHHAVLQLLRKYFGLGRLKFCESHKHPDRLISRGNTETNYEKSHDFNLDLPIDPETRYLVQIRNPLDALDSWWRLDYKNGNYRDMSLPEMRALFHQRMTFYHGFIAKWILNPVPNRLVVPYEDLLDNPRETFRTIHGFLTDEEIDEVQLSNALALKPVVRRSKPRGLLYIRA